MELPPGLVADLIEIPSVVSDSTIKSRLLPCINTEEQVSQAFAPVRITLTFVVGVSLVPLFLTRLSCFLEGT